MKNKKRLLHSLLGGALTLVTTALAAAEKPNGVMVLADDLGWGDPQSYNPESKIPTPNIERLASQGIRLTEARRSRPFLRLNFFPSPGPQGKGSSPGSRNQN